MNTKEKVEMIVELTFALNRVTETKPGLQSGSYYDFDDVKKAINAIAKSIVMDMETKPE